MKLLHLQIVNRILDNQMTTMESLINLVPTYKERSYLKDSIEHTKQILDIVRSDESEQAKKE